MPKKPEKKQETWPRIKKALLAIAIAIIFVLFVGYGIETFYKSPRYENYCKPIEKFIGNETDCSSVNGTWVAPQGPCAVDDKTCQRGYCDTYSKCSKAYQDAFEPHNKYVFIAANVIGVIALIIGGFVLTLESVSTGIMGGGILTMIYGTIRYWGQLEDIARFLILGLVLVILVWMGYKKLKK